jgi:NIMA (never in mitosis gene a)-related kinase
MEPLNINEFLYHKYKIIDIITKNKIKKVFLAERISNKEKIIIKEINLLNLDEQQKNIITQEGIIFLNLKHDNIVNYEEFHIENNEVYIIMEYCEEDLSKKIQRQKNLNQYFEEKQIIDWFIEICEGIKFIHDKKILYKNLNTENIFLTKDNHIKLGDFGIDKYFNQTKGKIGIGSYLSPEIIKGENYNYKNDIWNLGIILYELTQLKHPFEDKEISYENKIKRIEKGEFFEFVNANYSVKILNLIQSLLKVNPNERLNMNDIILECHIINIKRNYDSNKK